jgi:hypothetical protein
MISPFGKGACLQAGIEGDFTGNIFLKISPGPSLSKRGKEGALLLFVFIYDINQCGHTIHYVKKE